MIKFLVLAFAVYLIVRVVLARRPTWHVNAVIAIVIVGSLLSILLHREIWPFSHYPMFASVQSDELKRIRLYGITDEKQSREIEMLGEYSSPFGEPDLVYALDRIARRNGGQRQLEVAVRDCLDRYEERRKVGAHDGPPLVGVRMYFVRWKLDANASNRDQPTEKELWLEVIPANNSGAL